MRIVGYSKDPSAPNTGTAIDNMNAPFLTGQTMDDLARSLRLAIVQNQYDRGNLTLEQARELLCAELTTGEPTTFFDDSEYLKANTQ